MAIDLYKPTSPGRRGMSTQDFGEITKNEPEKSLLEHKVHERSAATTTAASPRASAAAATSSATASSTSSATRPACRPKVVGIEYDPNRTARIALLQYADGEKALHPRARQRLGVGDDGDLGQHAPTSSRATRCRSASSRSAPTSTTSSSRSAAARSSAARPAPRSADGEGGRLGHAPPAVGRDAPRPHRLPRHRSARSATPSTRNIQWARPAARAGSASARTTAASSMNPVDHPMGGGEGRSSGGRHPCTPWGVPTKGSRPATTSGPSSSSSAAASK